MSRKRDVFGADLVREPDGDRRLEFQDVGSVDKPLYVGVAPPGSATSSPVWHIQKFTWVTGPAGSTVPATIATRTGPWDDRASLF